MQTSLPQKKCEPYKLGTSFTVSFFGTKISRQHICSVSDDSQALIWDLTDMGAEVTAPLLEYGADAEITNLTWTMPQTDWVGLCFGKQVQILRVY